MLPIPIVIGLVALVIVLIVLACCRAAGRADASMEAYMARERSEERRSSARPIAVPHGDSILGRDRVTRERRARVKAIQRAHRRPRRQPRALGLGIELESDIMPAGQFGPAAPHPRPVLGVRPTLEEARAFAREVFAVPGPIRVIYFHDLDADCYRGWLTRPGTGSHAVPNGSPEGEGVA